MARALVQASMPHSRPEGLVFERTNGAFSLVASARRVAVRHGAAITPGAAHHGGGPHRRARARPGRYLVTVHGAARRDPGIRWGSITRLRDQMRRLFASTVSCTYDAPGTWALATVTIADRARLWWDPKQPDQTAL
jgi:hypothetical protein